MQEIDVIPLDPARFAPLLEPAQAHAFRTSLEAGAKRLDGHTYWHVNSTAAGGGVAEMLQSVLCYVQGAGIATRWAVMDGDDEFFVVTKRIHHFLHGSEGDAGVLGDGERSAYLATVERECEKFARLVRSGDVVVLHDPQTVGFAPRLRDLGASVIWSCHVGTDDPNATTRQAWDFLAPFARAADRVVFSRRTYAWDGLGDVGIDVIPPCIDAFSPKNQALEPGVVDAILAKAGITGDADGAPAEFQRQDGEAARVEARAAMIDDEPIPAGARLVTQISRWDPLKDHGGVMVGFCRHVPERFDAHLVLAGPSPESVVDDPEGGETLEALHAQREQLPASWRRRVHIACLPMEDLEQNAAIVNALQRHSEVIVQKSLAEGFGLTVAEAMWKEAPTVASAVGGIQDQIEDGVTGVLVDDPGDLTRFATALSDLLDRPEDARALGRRAHESVRDHYLAPGYLGRFLDLASSLG